jgi:hypothetical protein
MSLAVLAGLLGCGGQPPVRETVAEPPPVAAFFARVEVDPMGAAALARASLVASQVDEATRRRIVARWSREVPRLEALRDARLADAEALLAQGALGAATDAVSESAALEAAIGLPGSPRSVAQLAREIEWARLAAERTAREAGERARGAFRDGRLEVALAAASEARQLRARAGLPGDVGLAVLEGLAGGRSAPAPPVAEATVAPVARGVARPVTRRPVAPGARRAPVEAPAAEAVGVPVSTADPLAALHHAWRADDLPGSLRALARARADGLDSPELTALGARIEARRDAVVSALLEAAAGAYAREDLESARAHWERVLALAPGEPTATEGLTVYRRFVALQPGGGR